LSWDWEQVVVAHFVVVCPSVAADFSPIPSELHHFLAD
jgi:hypothetical protein